MFENAKKNIIAAAALAALTSMSAFTAPAQALTIKGPFKNCGQYAGAAVNQQVKNLQLSCGFKTSGWNTDYNKHKNWCDNQGVNAPIVASEHNFRRKALSGCIAKKLKAVPKFKGKITLAKKDCNAYAALAVQQQKMNQNLSCGLSGNNWTTSFAAHKNWCSNKNVTKSIVARETSIRANALKNCIKN